MEPERFYYIREKESKKPLITVCLIMGKTGLLARGVAYCSPLDSPCKKTGRNIAKGRAIKALIHKKNNDSVSRLEIGIISGQVDFPPWEFKSCYPAELDNWERKLLGL